MMQSISVSAMMIISLLMVDHVVGFVHVIPYRKLSGRPWGVGLPAVEESVDAPVGVHAIRAPLKFVGPYPALALTFPDLATSSQRSKNMTGISLDFVLDTAANVNTINAQVAEELELEEVGQALPGLGTAGLISGGTTYSLGDAQLEGVGNFTFMTNLTASALPVASPATAGLLSLAFFQSIDGVDLDWDRNPESIHSITFYDDFDATVVKDRQKLTIDRIPITALPSVTLEINGVPMKALLDTGSPVTVLNSAAAEKAGVHTVELPPASSNPLVAMKNRAAEAQAAARGELLQVLDVNRNKINLLRTVDRCHVTTPAEDGCTIDFGKGHVFVGDLPGLAALSGIGVDAPPAIVLGLDVLRQKPRMLVRAAHNEVWF